jgi:hypothetical protein
MRALEHCNPALVQALYISFFDVESDKVKAENPKLKHSQIQQEVSMLLIHPILLCIQGFFACQVWQRWQRSPQNPKNQPRASKGDAGADE